MTNSVRAALCLLVSAGLMSGCEMTIDPQTGARSTQWTLPGTTANEASFNERWRRCTQFASQSYCEQQFNGRTPMESGFAFGSGRHPDP